MLVFRGVLECSRKLVNGWVYTYKWGILWSYNPLILTIDPNFQTQHPSKPSDFSTIVAPKNTTFLIPGLTPDGSDINGFSSHIHTVTWPKDVFFFFFRSSSGVQGGPKGSLWFRNSAKCKHMDILGFGVTAVFFFGCPGFPEAPRVLKTNML